MKQSIIKWPHTFDSLRNPNFRLFLFGLLFMMGAFQMKELVVGYLVYDMTSSPFVLAVVESGLGITILLFGLFGGVVADRIERRLLIQGGQFATVLSALAIALAITTDAITWLHLLIAGMFEGICFAFLIPARHAIIPQIVGYKNITNGLALVAAGMSITGLIMPVISGTLYSMFGPGRVYYIIVGLRTISYLFFRALPKISDSSLKPKSSVFNEIKEGLFNISQNRILFTLLLMGLLQPLLVVPFRVLLPALVVEIYQRGPEAMGLLLSMMGIGSLIGSLFVASIGKGNRGLFLLTGGFSVGVALLLTSLIPIYLAAIVIIVMAGLGENGHRALNQSLVIEQVDDQYRGRIISVFLLTYGLTPLGVLPAGLIAQTYGVQVAVGVLAISILFVSGLLATQNQLRRLS